MSTLITAARTRPALNDAPLPVSPVALLWTFLAIIAGVSLFDLWITFQTRDSILYMEENPICYWLIWAEPRYLSVFLPFKLLGTAFVVVFCRRVYALNDRIGLQVAGGVAAFQTWLLFYLAICEPTY